MARGQIKRVIFYLLPIIVLIILASIFLVNLFPKATGQSRGAILSLADKIAGKETIKAGEIVINPAHLEAIDHLKIIIKRMISSSDSECYLSYQYGSGSDYRDNLLGNNGFPSLGERGTRIVFEEISKGMRVTTFGGADGLQEYSSEVIEGVSPCVISGGSVP